MNPATILGLIQIAAQLAQVIDAEVQANNDAEVQAAWLQAQQMFNQGGAAVEAGAAGQ